MELSRNLNDHYWNKLKSKKDKEDVKADLEERKISMLE